MTDLSELGAATVGVCILVAWAHRYRVRARASADWYNREAKERMRGRWLNAILAQPSHYVLAVQTIRNSIMAASFIASALAVLVASVAAWASELNKIGQSVFTFTPIIPMGVKLAIAVLCSVLAITQFLISIRYYHQLGYTFAPGEQSTNAEAAQQLLRMATRCYGYGMRWTFALMITIAWIISPWLAVVMLASIALVTTQ